MTTGKSQKQTDKFLLEDLSETISNITARQRQKENPLRL